MRKLATIRKIEEIRKIPDADKICAYRIDGWWVVDFIDLFKVGDMCIYIEVDAWIPRMPQVEHLYERAKKIFNDREGIRIKTIKLRGQISQGLVLPLNKFPDAFDEFHQTRIYNPDEPYFDVSDIIGIEKYERPVPQEQHISGNFPAFIQKTDQERAQNLVREIFVHNIDIRYELTLKLDGTSFTGYFYNGEDGVCGRNWKLEIDDDSTNALVRMYIDSGLQDILRVFGQNLAIQAEVMGPAIQKNREGLSSHKLFIFDIYKIDDGRYMTPDERTDTICEFVGMGLCKSMVNHVPIFYRNVSLADLGITNMDELLAYSDGKSLNHPVREGIVYKSMNGDFSFKAISNKFLLLKEEND
jgi:RNA ligase (TIGR02306 family)